MYMEIDRFFKASFSFFKAIKQIIKAAAHQERYGLADVVLLIKEAPATMPKVRLFCSELG